MADVRFQQARPLDAVELVVKMRQADIDECKALGIEDFVGRVKLSIQRSAFAYTVTVDNALMCILGVAPMYGMFDPVGIPWMLGTDLVRKHQRVLMRECRPYIREMLRAYPHLVNYVSAENHTSKRWLRRVGFTLQPAEPFGPLGATFHRFDMRA